MSKNTGIRALSVLDDVPYFNVTKCFPQDLMHVVLEGILNQEIRLILKHFVLDEKTVTLSVVNAFLKGFPYPCDASARPSEIEKKHLTSTKLNQYSAQMIVFAYLMPFLLADKLHLDETEPHFSCYLMLLKILSICLSFELSVTDVSYLRYLIGMHLQAFVKLYPDDFLPKHHFMIHIPKQILMFGVPRQYWCMRFEGLNCLEKGHVVRGKNFKNVPKTIAERHQALMALNLSHSRYLKKEVSFEKPSIISQDIASEIAEFLQVEICPSDTVFVEKLRVYGFSYDTTSYIHLNDDLNELPQFGKVSFLILCHGRGLLVVDTVQTNWYETKYHALSISCSVSQKHIVDLASLNDRKPYSSVNTSSGLFILLTECPYTG